MSVLELEKDDADLIVRAVQAVREKADEVASDQLRPAYHFRPPAYWSNDPTGTIYHNGWYHMFYQHNPYEDVWGPMHWGHALSRDMIHWEHLPLALVPSDARGESGCWSGCCVVPSGGVPTIFYTSIRKPGGEFEAAEQWVAVSDDDLIDWSRPECNPIMTEQLHGQKKVYDWRDPYIFEHEDEQYMVLGGNVNRRGEAGGVVMLYRANDTALRDWTCLGEIYRHPEVDVVQLDCPNLFPVGDRWVLLFSPWHGSVRYLVGDMDFSEPHFIPRTSGLFDYGPDLFATNTMMTPDGRFVLWAWVRGFKQRRGWQGCMTLPRTLKIGPNGALLQAPCSEVEQLRGRTWMFHGQEIEGEWIVPDVEGDALEIECTLEIGDASEYGFDLLYEASQVVPPARICHDSDGLAVAGTQILPPRKGRGEQQHWRIFIDRSVIEAFIDNGRYTITRVVYPQPGTRQIRFYSKGGKTIVRELKIYQMQTDGIFTDHML